MRFLVHFNERFLLALRFISEWVLNEELFQSDFVQLAIREYQLKLIIYNSNQGGLTGWIN